MKPPLKCIWWKITLNYISFWWIFTMLTSDPFLSVQVSLPRCFQMQLLAPSQRLHVFTIITSPTVCLNLVLSSFDDKYEYSKFAILLTRWSLFPRILAREPTSSFERVALGELSMTAVAQILTTEGTIFSRLYSATASLFFF